MGYGQQRETSAPATWGFAMALNHSPHQLRQKAEEVRTIAEGCHDPDARRIFMNLAANYELLARHAEHRIAAQQKSGTG